MQVICTIFEIRQLTKMMRVSSVKSYFLVQFKPKSVSFFLGEKMSHQKIEFLVHRCRNTNDESNKNIDV